MQSNSPDPMNFKDPQTLTAIILVFVIFIGWNFYMREKYPDIGKPPAQTTAQIQNSDSGEIPQVVDNSVESVNNGGEPQKSAPVAVEKTVEYEANHAIYSIHSRGMGIRKVSLKDYTGRDGKPYHFDDSEVGYFATRLIGQKEIPNFDIKVNGSEVVGTATLGGYSIEKVMVFKGNHAIEISVSVSGTDRGFDGLVHTIRYQYREPEGGNFLMPSFDLQEAMLSGVDSTTESATITESIIEPISLTPTHLLSAGNQYFAAGLLDRSDIKPNGFAQSLGPGLIEVRAEHRPVNRANTHSFKMAGYIGPKDHGHLAAVSPRMTEVIDYGIFSFLAEPILLLLRWFHTVTGNWGFAIILLTLLVRGAVAPFNIMSYKSMKKMQVIQPRMKAIREKYKDDPQTMNREIMTLMSTEKVNPLGGCLPMLLQIPVFFALYQVLGQSIELYQAPFIGWITDLSLKDPYYVLPILMGATFYMQTKMTPQTGDENMQRVMQFMPIIFSVMMLTLPSGLTLYIFISTLFGVLQQMFFMRDRNSTVVAQNAKA